MLKILKKYLSIILVLIFLLLVSFYNYKEFDNNFKQNLNYENQLALVKEKISNFDLKQLKKIEKINFFYTPYKGLLDKLVSEIENAKKQVFIEVYMFTENSRLPNALLRAKKRGVDIRVLLEKQPYKTPNINNKIYNFFKKNNISVVFSNSSNYSLNHSKFFIIDNKVIISTGNLTYSTFAFNRDFFLFIKDKKIVDILKRTFNYDFKGIKNALYSENLVISPNYSRSKIKKIFLSAKKSLKMYFQYLEDRKLENILIKKAKSGITIEIIVADSFAKNHKEKINFLKSKNINIIPLKKVKMHAKAILMDDKILFIGSENFSNYSLDKNREVGILIQNKNVIKKFKKIFSSDFANLK